MKQSRNYYKSLKHRATYLGVWSARFTLSLFPIATARGIGAAFGYCAWIIAISERRKALSNLQIAYPYLQQKVRSQSCKEMFVHLGRALAEVLIMDKIIERLDDYVVVDAQTRAIFNQALKADKRTIVITGHLGNWELLGVWLAHQGYPTATVAKPMTSPYLNTLLQSHRRRYNIDVILRNEQESSLPLLRKLKQPGFMGFLIDQDTTVPSVFVDFFGKKAKTPLGAALLAIKIKCPVICAFCTRQSDGRYRIDAEGPLELPPSSNIDSDIIRHTQIFNRHIERAVRANPNQWVWTHRRWKTKPKECP